MTHRRFSTLVYPSCFIDEELSPNESCALKFILTAGMRLLDAAHHEAPNVIQIKKKKKKKC